MTTATPTYPTLGHKLAAELRRARLRRKARPRAKRRTTKRQPKPRTDPRVSAFMRDLERTPNGRRTLQLVADLGRARLVEDVAECGLETAEITERELRERLCTVATNHTAEAYCQATDLQVQILTAEHETRTWRRELAKHRGERERLEAELRHLAGYL